MQALKMFLWSLLFSGIGICEGQHQQWGDLKPGPFGIGFRSMTITDSTRRYENFSYPYREPGRNQYRIIPLFIWYPADIISSSPYKKYFEHLVNEQPGITDELLQQLRKGRSISEDAWLKAIEIQTPIGMNAPPRKERFPVVLHSHATGLLMQTILMEYLASHGYVVISFPRLGADPLHFNWNDGSVREELASAEDIGFITSKLSSIVNYADTDNVAFVGAMSEKAVSHACRVDDLKAIACIGCFLDERVKLLPDFDVRRFRTPILQVTESWKNNNKQFIDSLTSAPRWTVRFKELDHRDMYPMDKIFSTDKSKQTVKYEYLCALTREFLDAILKQHAVPETFKSIPAEEILNIQAVTRVHAEPTQTELMAWVKAGEIDKAKEAIKFHKNSINGQLLRQLISVMAMNNSPFVLPAVQFYLSEFPIDPEQSFMYIFRFCATENMALDIFNQLRQKFNKSPSPYDGLSDYYEAIGNKVRMKEYARKGIDLLQQQPVTETSRELEKKLQEKLDKKS